MILNDVICYQALVVFRQEIPLPWCVLGGGTPEVVFGESHFFFQTKIHPLIACRHTATFLICLDLVILPHSMSEPQDPQRLTHYNR